MNSCCGCFSSLFGKKKSNHFARYNEADYTIEFENLIEEEDFSAPSHHSVTEIEKDFLKKRKYGELLQHQNEINQKQDEMLKQKEEEARLEDEAYIQAKKEAAKARKLKENSSEKHISSKSRAYDSGEFSKWLAQEKIDVTDPNMEVEDFDTFMEKVRTKSAQAFKDTDENNDEMFEKSLQQGVEATIIAGDALNSINPVELHTSAQILEERYNKDSSLINERRTDTKTDQSVEDTSDGYWSASHFESVSDSSSFSTPTAGEVITTRAIVTSPEKNINSVLNHYTLNAEIIQNENKEILPKSKMGIISTQSTKRNAQSASIITNGKVDHVVSDDDDNDDDDFVTDDGDFEELLI